MNEELGSTIVALLKQDGHLSSDDLASRLGAANEADMPSTLARLVDRGDVKRSQRGQYYVSGHVSASLPPKTREKRAVTTAVVKFGLPSMSGVGFEVDDEIVMPGDVRTHQELLNLFCIGNMGGIRVSKKVGAVVLISSVHNSLYKDRQRGDVFHYTGEGRHGDQTLTRGNRAIARSLERGTPLLLFLKKNTNEYEYQGEVRLAGEPTQELQPDEDGMTRSVWVFPLEPM